MDQVQKISIFLPHKSDDSVWEMGTKWQEKARPPKESERYYGLMHVESALMEKIRKKQKNVRIFQPLTPSLSAKTV